MTDIDAPRTGCGEIYPGPRQGEANPLTCIKPAGHSGEHVTALGYHPPPHDEYEFDSWPSASQGEP